MIDLSNTELINHIKEGIKSLLYTIKDNIPFVELIKANKNINTVVTKIEKEKEDVGATGEQIALLRNALKLQYIFFPILIFASSFVLLFLFPKLIIWYILGLFVTTLIISSDMSHNNLLTILDVNFKYNLFGILVAMLVAMII